MSTKYFVGKKFRVNIEFASNKFCVEIECLDLPTVYRWYDSIKDTYAGGANVSFVRNPAYLDPKSIDKTYLDGSYKKILQAIELLKSYGIEWPENEPEEFNYSTEWCNKIHRYFTTLGITQNKLSFNDRKKYQLNFKDPIFVDAVHTLNNEVHILENYCLTDYKQIFNMQMKYISVKPIEWKTGDYHYRYIYHQFNVDDYKYHTVEKCDVVFEDEILGKHILNSFFDNDNPNNLDTTGYKGWFGGFKIYSDDIRQRIYNSLEFLNWLEQHKMNINTIRADFPIGNIVYQSNNFWEDIYPQCQNSNILRTYLEFDQ